MLANLQLIRQEEDILLNSKCETPLTNYLLFNTKYKDAMRKTMLKTNTPLVNK